MTAAVKDILRSTNTTLWHSSSTCEYTYRRHVTRIFKTSLIIHRSSPKNNLCHLHTDNHSNHLYSIHSYQLIYALQAIPLDKTNH